MPKIFTPVILLALFLFSSCAQLAQITQSTLNQNAPLSELEIVSGLKEALLIGTDSSVAKLSAVDGYLKDQAVKILLPPEAKEITENISKLPGGQKLVDDVIVRVNRAAEDAAKGAKPIFAKAIREMTFDDALQILKGPDNAATQYFRDKTYLRLADLYRPKIHESLNKNLIAGISTQESWNELTTNWNKIAGTTVGKLAGLKTVNVQLEDYMIQKALDGLFLKIADREKDIRTNAGARVTTLLKRVFGNQSMNTQMVK